MSNVTQVLSEAYDLICELGFTPQRNILLVKINELLEELEKCEPVAWYKEDKNGYMIAILKPELLVDGIGLYTSPPKREWVGLSNEQIYEIVGDGVMDIALAIEAKLRELNTKG